MNRDQRLTRRSAVRPAGMMSSAAHSGGSVSSSATLR